MQLILKVNEHFDVHWINASKLNSPAGHNFIIRLLIQVIAKIRIKTKIK